MEDRKGISPEAGESRRDVIKKLAYAAPAVLSLAASPSLASAGSGSPRCHSHADSRATPNRRHILN